MPFGSPYTSSYPYAYHRGWQKERRQRLKDNANRKQNYAISPPSHYDVGPSRGGKVYQNGNKNKTELQRHHDVVERKYRPEPPRHQQTEDPATARLRNEVDATRLAGLKVGDLLESSSQSRKSEKHDDDVKHDGTAGQKLVLPPPAVLASGWKEENTSRDKGAKNRQLYTTSDKDDDLDLGPQWQMLPVVNDRVVGVKNTYNSINRFNPGQYEEYSPEWKLAMLQYLLDMKANGHQLKEVEINLVRDFHQAGFFIINNNMCLIIKV